MSFFAVTIQEIDKTWPIEGADAIELAKVKNFTWQFVVRKGSLVPGDVVAYFPLDAIIPQSVLEKMGMVGKFSGKDKDRVKTKTFRGQISQGFVCKVEELSDFIPKSQPLNVGVDLTEFLGVIKYEPPVVPDKAGKLYPLPAFCHGKYDIEGCDNYPDVVQMLMDQRVAIFEKMEGSNFSTGMDASEKPAKLYVSQRNYTIVPIEGHIHDFWKVAKNQKIIDAAQALHRHYCGSVLIRGEMLGPGYQGNIYKLKDHEVMVYDLMLDDKYVDAGRFFELCDQYNLKTCPVLAKNVILRDWLAGRTIDEAATGESVLFKTLREGIVIKPMVESRNNFIGRTIIKHRSAKYLAKQED